MKIKPVAWMSEFGQFIGKVQDEICHIPLYTHPVKELHLSLQKSQDGELLAVTYTDDEHRIVEVLWEKPPVKEQLTDEEIEECYWGDGYPDNPRHPKEFANAILRKAQEK